jgi:membrane fusion protein (multidrug efflux system)
VEIETGVVENGFVEILSGLEVGDRIVGSGLNRIQPGAPVSVAGAGRGQGAQSQGAQAQGGQSQAAQGAAR